MKLKRNEISDNISFSLGIDANPSFPAFPVRIKRTIQFSIPDGDIMLSLSGSIFLPHGFPR